MPYALVMRPVLRSRPLIGRYRRMADIAEPVVDSLLSRMTQNGHAAVHPVCLMEKRIAPKANINLQATLR